MHFFQSSLETLTARRVHRKEGERLCERHPVGTPVQKFNVGTYFAKHRTESHFPEGSPAMGPFASRAEPPVADKRCTAPTNL